MQLLRTVPEHTYAFAERGEFSILDGYLRALRSAAATRSTWRTSSCGPPRSSKCWSTNCVIRRDPDFRMVLVLPREPSNGADTTRGQLGRLLDADNDAGPGAGGHGERPRRRPGRRRSTCTPRSASSTTRWLTIGSANLNEHSLFNDTEVNILTLDRRARPAHPVAAVGRTSGTAPSRTSTATRPPSSTPIWKPVAKEQLERTTVDLPPDRRVSRLAAVSRRTERLIGPIRGLLVDA